MDQGGGFLGLDRETLLTWITIISAGAVFFGHYISFYNARASRIADNRVRWIEEFRKELAQYISNFSLITHLSQPSFNGANAKKITELYAENYELRLMIELRLNPTEQNHELFRTKLMELNQYMNTLEGKPITVESTDVYRTKRDELVVLTKQIFKCEWVKAKEGK